MGRKVEGAAVPLSGGGARSPPSTMSPGPRPTSIPWHLDPSSHLATTDMGRKLGAVPLLGGTGSGSPSAQWPGLRPTSVPSGIVMRSTIWPQYTNVTDKQDIQRSDSIGRTILQTVAQKLIKTQVTRLVNACIDKLQILKKTVQNISAHCWSNT